MKVDMLGKMGEEFTWKDFKCVIAHNPLFTHFRFLLHNEPLLKFVYYEKCRYTPQPVETRIAYISDLKTGSKRSVAGYQTNSSVTTKSQYDPEILTPFELKGIWLPVNEGILYSTLNQLNSCPLVKQKDENQFILFLIHPESEALYTDILQQHADEIIRIPALSLSSTRTVLISMPNEAGINAPIMVKLSLNKVLFGSLRILTKRSCKLSVGNSTTLKLKLLKSKQLQLEMGFFEEPLAYVPKNVDAGMIYRQLPDCLNSTMPNRQGLYLVPLFCTQGVKNRAFLREIIQQNGGNATHFFKKCFLLLFAEIYLFLLLSLQISIEAHAQNLLLMLDKKQKIKGLMYRDMGGVNQLIDKEDLALLPANLQDPKIYYFETHHQDASVSLEHHFVLHVLGPLTRQLVKDSFYRESDTVFNSWYTKMKQCHFLQNWTLENLEVDDYQTYLSIHHFYRYGYVELIFMQCLLSCLRKNNIVSRNYLKEIRKSFFMPEKANYFGEDLGDVPPCSKNPYFRRLIFELLI